MYNVFVLKEIQIQYLQQQQKKNGKKDDERTENHLEECVNLMKRLFCIKEYKELNRNFSFLNCTD